MKRRQGRVQRIVPLVIEPAARNPNFYERQAEAHEAADARHQRVTGRRAGKQARYEHELELARTEGRLIEETPGYFRARPRTAAKADAITFYDHPAPAARHTTALTTGQRAANYWMQNGTGKLTRRQTKRLRKESKGVYNPHKTT